MAYPCDGCLEGAENAYYRGLTIQASPEVLYRWLCQLQAANYSYDWIDSWGRRSPQRLIPGLDNLTVGQAFGGLGNLVDFEPDRQITTLMKPGTAASLVLGQWAASYVIVPQTPHRCRLLVKFLSRYPKGPWGLLLRLLLPWGDLIMCRRQLLNLKRLSEQTPGQGRPF